MPSKKQEIPEADHAGHRERLRERFRLDGLQGFAPHEALELLLTYAIPRINVNPLAHRLIDHFGGLPGVLEATPQELCQVNGVGERTAAMLALMLPMMRMYEQEKLTPKRQLATYADLVAYCRSLFLGMNDEQFYVLCFDARLRLLSAELIATGMPTAVEASPRAVLRQVLRHNAVGAVISHNHPSGSPLPSQEDMDVTAEIKRLLDGAEVRLYDHVIVGGQEHFSFQREGLLETGGGLIAFPQRESTPLAADRPQRVLSPKGK